MLGSRFAGASGANRTEGAACGAAAGSDTVGRRRSTWRHWGWNPGFGGANRNEYGASVHGQKRKPQTPQEAGWVQRGKSEMTDGD